MTTPKWVCWIIEPVARGAWVATLGLLAEVTDGILRAGDLEMPSIQIPL